MIRHEKACPCAQCVCRRWLSYTPPEDRRQFTLKTQRYGWPGAGSGLPDHAYTAIAAEADLHLALSRVEDPFLRAVGKARRETDPPKEWLRKLSRDQRETTRSCPARFVIEEIKSNWALSWYEAEAQQPDHTLGWLLERCAVEMAEHLTVDYKGEPWVLEAAEIPPPPELLGVVAERMVGTTA